jgi:hypothetical protein
VSGAGTALAADLSGLIVRFDGLDDALAAAIGAAWTPFLTDTQREPWLDVSVEASDLTFPTDRPMRPVTAGEVRDGVGRFRSDQGEIAVDADGSARLRLGRGDDRWRFWGLVNLVTAAFAVRLPSRPGAILHAAGVVVDGRAFVLVGPEGAGKSTFARLAGLAGARVIGDDAVILDGGAGALTLLGSPVRAHEASRLGPGRWPVAAILHPRKGSGVKLDPVGRLAAEAVITANLPFLASGWGRDARLDALVSYLSGTVPHRLLTFAPDPSFVDVLRNAAV